ncbi:larval cuticle protein 65Ag1-like [Drosophila albomicans]|uniref:Larval cuticle protein 65Ag1-like n=1 Tax=Drosophila albomicans TaxID=7291 RepID=A0A6P8X585_DROAB|nr:larval cuticle protein 65Ag1-like [Drosophila albomicans]
MKFLIVFVALFAVALAAPPTSEVQVLRSESDVGPESFKHTLETSDGTNIEAEGELKQVGEEPSISVKGRFSYVDPEGQTHVVTYIADENGYQPISDDIPVAPAV